MTLTAEYLRTKWIRTPVPTITKTPRMGPVIILTKTPTKTVTNTPTETQTPTITLTPTPTPTVTPTANPLFPFEDNFDEEPVSSWHITRGKPRIVNHTLYNSAAPLTMWVGNEGWVNYEVEIRAIFNCGRQEGTYVGVRVQSPDDMMAVAWSGCWAYWFIIENGNWERVPETETRIKPEGYRSWVEYKITVRGDHLKFTPTSGETSEIVLPMDSQFQNGGIIIHLSLSNDAVDYVKVRQIP